MVKGPGDSFLNMIINHDEQEVAPGKWNVTAAFQKLEFECFSSPYISITCLVKKKQKNIKPITHTTHSSYASTVLSRTPSELLQFRAPERY